MIECKSCGCEQTKVIKRSKAVVFREEHITVAEHDVTICEDCGEEFYTKDQAIRLDKKIIGAYRKQQNLLSSDDIRTIRSALFLSQTQLESALGLGAKTVVRWENDTGVQGKNTDNVLRLIALDPDNLRVIIHLRNAALIPLLEKKNPEDDKRKAWISQTIFAALESFDAGLQVSEMAERIAEELINSKMRRIERFVHDTQVAIS